MSDKRNAALYEILLDATRERIAELEAALAEKERELAELREAIGGLEFAVYNFDRKGNDRIWCCEFCEVASKPIPLDQVPYMEELPHATSCLWKRYRKVVEANTEDKPNVTSR